MINAKTTSERTENGLSLDDFELENAIGHGPFVEMWKVREKRSLELFIMKKIVKNKVRSFMNQFCREIQNMYRANHPNIVKLRCHFEDSEAFYLVMDWVEGITLAQKIMIEKKISEEKSFYYIKKAVDAIEFLHSLEPPIIYKYIKSENIIVDYNQNVRLLNLIWADVDEDRNDGSARTLEYLAPELLKKSGFTASADVWCIGVLLYEMVYGRTPFKNSSSMGVLNDIRICDVKFSEDNPKLNDLLMKILKKEHKTRLSFREIRTHDWYQQFNAGIKTGYEVDPDDALSIVALKKQVMQKKEENTEIRVKICDLNSEMEFYSSVLARIEEKTDAAMKKKESLVMSIENLNESLYEIYEDVEICKDSNDLLEERVKIIRGKHSDLCVKTDEFLRKKIQKAGELSNIEFLRIEQEKKLDYLKKELGQLQFEEIENSHKIINLCESKSLIKTCNLVNICSNDLNLINESLNECNSKFKDSCDEIPFKIDVITNMISLREKLICELDKSHNEKVIKITEEQKKNKKNILGNQRRISIASYEKLIRNYEELIEKSQKSEWPPRKVDEDELKNTAQTLDVINI